MDLILISDEKLKIILSEEDLKEFNIDIETLDYSNVSTKRVFWDILDKAKETAGFDADKSKLYVQVFPSSDGGCEMFVTKFSQSSYKKNSHSAKTYRISKSSYDKHGKLIAANFDDICNLCKRLVEENLHLHTSLFFDESGMYLLTVKKNKRVPSYLSLNNSFASDVPEYLCEYGSVHILNDRAIAYLNEHCKKIAVGNAAEILAFI